MVTFVKPQLLAFDGNEVTDHNRSPLQISIERIEDKRRMANGTLRKYVVADKRTFNVSWTNLPNSAEHTVDGYWGADEMYTFYSATLGSFDLTILYDTGNEEVVEVMFQSFSKELSKRGIYMFYDVSVDLEEV